MAQVTPLSSAARREQSPLVSRCEVRLVKAFVVVLHIAAGAFFFGLAELHRYMQTFTVVLYTFLALGIPLDHFDALIVISRVAVVCHGASRISMLVNQCQRQAASRCPARPANRYVAALSGSYNTVWHSVAETSTRWCHRVEETVGVEAYLLEILFEILMASAHEARGVSAAETRGNMLVDRIDIARKSTLSTESWKRHFRKGHFPMHYCVPHCTPFTLFCLLFCLSLSVRVDLLYTQHATHPSTQPIVDPQMRFVCG